VRLANELPKLSRLGAEVVLASVDPPAAQLAMNERWRLPFPWVSDPGGERLAKPLDVWNAGERGGVFHPLVLLLGPDGEVLLRHRSRDFADRPDDRDILEALDGLGLPARQVPPHWSPQGLQPQATDGAFRAEAFGAYFRGLRLGTRALATRMRDDQDAAEVRQTSEMAGSFLEAWSRRREESA
jgi:hypothetical protein